MKRFPEGIAIDIGFSCNNNCLFCVNDQGRELSTPEVKKMLLEVRSFFRGIIFNGGEPTIRQDILELVSFANSIGYKTIMMISNGRMFSYENFCKNLIKAGLKLVFVTVQASHAKLHDIQTATKGSFQQTVEGIMNLKKFGIEVHTNTVINKLNYKDLPKLAQLFSELKVDFSKLSYMRIKGRADKNKDLILVRIKKIVPYVKRASENFISKKQDFIIQEVPTCVMKGYNVFLRKGDKMPLIAQKSLKSDEFEKKYYRGGNIKRKECLFCQYDDGCLGPWEEYVKYFGWEDFKPIGIN